MSEEQQFCLRWNNFQANITSQFEALRDEEDFVDVTLACDGQRLKAHKVVLSACSPYFKELFKSNPCKHPILFLRDVAFNHLRALVEFMYAGEVNVAQAQLPAFLRTAESLQIRGLTEAPQKHKQSHIRHQQTQPAPPSVQPSLTTATPAAATQETAEEADPSSPECIGIDEDEEALSMSPQVVASPPPSKRPCLPQNSASDTHSNPATSLEEAATSVKESAGGFIEPKLELPDYGSDGESKTNTAALFGLDSNSVDVNTSFAAALQSGGMEIIPGPSGQNFLGESSAALDPGQVDHRKLHSLDPRPCPICNRMYSNLSNLRQHVRLIHNPQIVMCPLCGKPFKTKLYLKRHLNSFHELLCNNGGVNKQMAGNDFYPPSPQVYLEADANKVSTDGVMKGKDQNATDIFQAPRGGIGRAANPNERITGFPNISKNKDVRIAQDAYQNSRGYYPSVQHFEDKSKSKSLDLFQMPRLFQSVMNPPHSLHANKENKSGYPVVSKSKDQQQSPEIYQSTSGYQSALDSVENSAKNNYQQQQQVKVRDLQQDSDFLQAPRRTANISQGGTVEKQKELYQGYDGAGNAFSGNGDETAVQIKEDKTSNSASEGSSYIGDLSLASSDSSRLTAQQQLPGNGIAEGLPSFLDQPTDQDASGFIHETFTTGDNRSPVDGHESGN